MSATYAIDDTALSPAEIELLVQTGRRNPDARQHGQDQARRISYRLAMGLSTLAASVWTTNAFVVLGHHAH